MSVPNWFSGLLTFFFIELSLSAFKTLYHPKDTHVQVPPQGTVLSPALFTLYTNDCQGTTKTPIVKYSDDTAIEDLSNSDSVYFSEVHKFSAWCKENYLDLNIVKTKEFMVVDFRKNPPPVPELIIDDVVVERVAEYRYLGTVLDNNLTFDKNVEIIYKKCQSRIYCLQKLRNIGVASDKWHSWIVLSCVHPISTHAIFYMLVWKSRCTWEESLNDVVNVCSKVVGKKQAGMQDLYEIRLKWKARQIADDQSHVLAKFFELLPSGRRYRTVKGKARFLKTFIPRSLHLLNS